MLKQTQISDTDSAAAKMRDNMLLRMSPEEKLRGMLQLCALGRRLQLGRIRKDHPGCSHEELKYRFDKHTLGADIADKYFRPANWTAGEQH